MEVLKTRIRQGGDPPPATLDTPDTPPQPQPLGEIKFNSPTPPHSPGYDYAYMDGGTPEALEEMTKNSP